MIKTKKIVVFSSALLILFICLGLTKAKADSIIQTYNSTSSTVSGMAVELKGNNSSTVTPLNSSDIQQFIGVVIPQSDSSIALVPTNSSSQQVLVSRSGNYGVLVSDQDGPIKSSDYLTISSIQGVAMKASSSQKYAIGQASAAFSSASPSILEHETLTTSSGQKQNVSIGMVTANINFQQNPIYQSNYSVLPSSLIKLANSIANKPVSPIRIYISLIILILSFLMVAIMLFSSVHGGLIALGRNPLAKKAISLSVLKTVVLGFTVLIASVLAVYVILL